MRWHMTLTAMVICLHTWSTGYRYCEKYGIDLDPRLEQLVGIRPQIPWRRFVNADNAHLCNNEVGGHCSGASKGKLWRSWAQVRPVCNDEAKGHVQCVL
eukprot:1160150-Pelagomonas_calceolata.AAC.3